MPDAATRFFAIHAEPLANRTVQRRFSGACHDSVNTLFKELHMKRLTAILASGAALLAVPAIAAMGAGDNGHPAGNGADQGGPDKPMMMGMDPSKPAARPEIESMVKMHFAELDTNKDGFLTKAEVDAAHQAMMAERQDAHFKEMDSDGNGSISRAEFDARMAARPTGEHGDGPDAMGHDHHGMGPGMGHAAMGGHRGGGMGERMFESADADKDGRVSLAEALAKPLQRFDQADSNKDGILTPAERQSARQSRQTKRNSAGD
jgi:hypothetical protein